MKAYYRLYCNCKYFLSCHHKRFCWFLDLFIRKKSFSWQKLMWPNHLLIYCCNYYDMYFICKIQIFSYCFIPTLFIMPQFHHHQLGLQICSKKLLEKFYCSTIIFSRSSRSKEVEDWTLKFWPQIFLSNFEKTVCNPENVRKTSVQQTILKLWFFLKSREVKRAEPNILSWY